MKSRLLISVMYNWDEAATIEKYGRRLPTVFELKQIQKSSSDKGFFWSSSPYAGDDSYAWGVYFYDGNDYAYGKSGSNYVRLVRVGQEFDFCHKVSMEEVEEFDRDGTLPDWHPPFSESVGGGDMSYTSNTHSLITHDRFADACEASDVSVAEIFGDLAAIRDNKRIPQGDIARHLLLYIDQAQEAVDDWIRENEKEED